MRRFLILSLIFVLSASAMARSRRAKPEPGWMQAENWGKLERGTIESDVRKMLGEPRHTDTARVAMMWYYQAVPVKGEPLPQEGTVMFKFCGTTRRGKIWRVLKWTEPDWETVAAEKAAAAKSAEPMETKPVAVLADAEPAPARPKLPVKRHEPTTSPTAAEQADQAYTPPPACTMTAVELEVEKEQISKAIKARRGKKKFGLPTYFIAIGCFLFGIAMMVSFRRGVTG